MVVAGPASKRIRFENKKDTTYEAMTNLSTKLAEHEASGKLIQIGLIGAGKFGSMLYVDDFRGHVTMKTALTTKQHLASPQISRKAPSRNRRPLHRTSDSLARTNRLPQRKVRLTGITIHRRRHQSKQNSHHDQLRATHRDAWHRCNPRSDRQSRRRRPPRSTMLRTQEAHRHGECRG
jgi:hypothetical protein